MPPTGTYFGVDLGTTSCSVAYVVDDPRVRASAIVPVQTVDVPVDEGHLEKRSNRMPSVVAAPSPDDRRRKKALFGWEFFHAFEQKKRDAALLSRGRDFFTSVKSDLGTERVYPRSVVPGCRTPVQVTALILERLALLAREGHSARDLRRSDAVLTVPASASALARAETREAAVAAGLDPARLQLLDEPVAALLDLLNSPDAAHVLTGDEERNVLVFDYGGGTCDVALVRVRYDAGRASGLHVENLAISAYHRLGGDDLDAAVMDQVVWPQIATGAERQALTLAARRQVEDTLTPTVARTLKERLCREVERLVRDDGWAAVDAEEPKTVVALPRELMVPELGRRVPHHFDMTAAQLRDAMAPFVAPPGEGARQTLLVPILETLQRGGLAPADLDVLVLHGGSSLNPFVHRLMSDTFGEGTLFPHAEVVHTPDPLASVARGAALFGYWTRARGVEIVQPIMSEDLGVVVRSGETVRLVRGGTPLPYPDEDSVQEVTGAEAALFVPGDALAEMLVPVYTGPAQSPRVAGTVRVTVPPDTAAGTPVRIRLRVERDKTLRWWFRLGDQVDTAATAVDDPWCARALSAEERRLLQHRRKMKEAVLRDQPLPAWILVAEANLMRQAGDLDGALLAIEQSLAETPADASAHNVRGLVLDQMGDAARAEGAFRTAADLAPTQAVYRGNLGATLAMRGRHDEAVAALRLAASLDPALPYVHMEMGDVFRRKGDEPSARREYERALQLLNKTMEERPFELGSWRRLVRLHQSLGQYRQADEARRVVAELEVEALYEGDPSAVVAGRDREAPVAPPKVR